MQERLEYGTSDSCEEHFRTLESAAVAFDSLTKQICKESAKLVAACVEGSLPAIGKLRATIGRLRVEQEFQLTTIMGFDEQAVTLNVGSRNFFQEIVDAAKELGLEGARVVRSSVLAFPNRLTVDEKGIKIGKRLIASSRPKALAAILKVEAASERQALPGFIDALKRAYDERARALGVSVPLTEIYDLLTLLPDSRKTFSEMDFVREISVVDAFGPHETRDGCRVSFPASTSARMSKGYKTVTPTGEDVTYASVRFDGVEKA